MLNIKAIQGIIGVSVGLALSACNTLYVKTDSNPELSVAMCHTYAFAHEHVANADHPAAYGNPLNADRLRAAIEANMAAKGLLRAADAKSADCVVGYAMGSRQVFEDYYGGIGMGFGYGWGWGGGGYWGYEGPWVRDETRIAVDVFDAKSRKAIWHASVSQTVSELSGSRAEAHISAATAAIFTKFPVGTPLPAAGRTST